MSARRPVRPIGYDNVKVEQKSQDGECVLSIEIGFWSLEDSAQWVKELNDTRWKDDGYTGTLCWAGCGRHVEGGGNCVWCIVEAEAENRRDESGL